MPYVPKTPFLRDSLGYCGDTNKSFLIFLFSDRDTGIQFLKGEGKIRSNVQCISCGRYMTWYSEPTAPDGFR
jgi:fructose-1-phosphate kinase PfkB-like protein